MTAILVTGSTGTLGRALVPRLTGAGHEARAFSRQPRPSSTPPNAWATGDLRANAGLDEALAGIEVIVHCASAQRGDQAAAQNLIAALRAGAVDDHVDPGQSLVQAGVGAQVAGGPRLWRGGWGPRPAAERPHLVSRRGQLGDQGAAQGARAAGNQDRGHGRLWSFPQRPIVIS